MPESGRRVYATHVGRVTKVIDAPLGYAYDWLTDYRSDDGKYSRSKTRFHLLRLSPDTLVRVRYSHPRSKPLAVAVEVVRLRPPDRWHKDTIDQIDLDSIDYKLTRLGTKRTRISLVIVERWMVPKFPPKADWVRAASNYWDALVSSLEEDCRAGRPAKG